MRLYGSVRVPLTDKSLPRTRAAPAPWIRSTGPGTLPRYHPGRGGTRRDVLTSERAATPPVRFGADGDSPWVLGDWPGQRRGRKTTRGVRGLRGGGCGGEAPSPGRRGLGELPGVGSGGNREGCIRSCWRARITSSWAATSTGPSWFPAASASTPTSRSPCPWRITRISPTATGPTCPPGCVSKGTVWLPPLGASGGRAGGPPPHLHPFCLLALVLSPSFSVPIIY